MLSALNTGMKTLVEEFQPKASTTLPKQSHVGQGNLCEPRTAHRTTVPANSEPHQPSEAHIVPDKIVLECLLNAAEVCAIIGVPKSTLYLWRSTMPGYGPPAKHVGRLLKWVPSELARWVAALPSDEVLDGQAS